MSTDDNKTPTKGALEEAVSLCDELMPFAESCLSLNQRDRLTDLQRRRAALEPRLAKRRENQARPDKETKP